MLDVINDNGKDLYSAKVRIRLTAVSWVLLVLSIIFLIVSRTNSVKVPALYLFTVCIMHLIVLHKNCLNKYEAGIFLFLCIQLMALAPGFGRIDSLSATAFLLSYRYGISSRGFVATIMDFLSNYSFVSKYFVWHFVFCSLIILSCLVSVCLGSVIKKAKDETRSFVLFLTILSLSCFTSPSAYFSYFNFGRTEIFALILMLILLTIIDKPGFNWFIPFLALFTISTHLVLVFFYIPFIFIMLLYKLICSENKKQSTALFIVTFIFVVGSFLLYILFHENTFVFPDAHIFAEYLKSKTDLGYSEGFLFDALYAKLQDHLSIWHNDVSLLYRGNVSILINIPLIVFFVIIWVNCFLHEKQWLKKIFFVLPVLLLLYHVPVFLMFTDYGRWMIMITMIQFMLIFYLVYTEDKTVLAVTGKMVPLINKNRFLIILMCSIMLFLGPVSAISPSDRIAHIVKGFLSIIQYH